MISIRHILKEPLVIFFISASILFLLEGIWLSPKEGEIVIDKNTQFSLIAMAEEQQGRSLLSEEKEAIIDKHVYEEILLSEAYRLGLDKDQVIRNKLLRKMRYLISADIVTPNDDLLRKYYQANKDKYKTPVRFDVELVEIDNSEDLEKFKKALDKGISIDSFVDDVFRSAQISRVSQRDIRIRYGKAMSLKLENVEIKKWQGPITEKSRHYFLKVVKVHESRVRNYDDVMKYVRDDWEQHERDRLVSLAVEDLKQNYTVSVMDDI